MATPKPKLATAADLAAGGDARREVIDGVITEKASPSAEHAISQLMFGAALVRRFQRKPGGRWPGGWWFATACEVEYEAHQIYLHDLSGWRRDRVPERPTGRPVRRPDWACEQLSPSNEKRDLVDKFNVLHANGVPHYWIADPIERTLRVHRWEAGGYLVVLSAGPGDLVIRPPARIVRAEPFDTVELSVSALFGDEDDEE